MDDSEHYFSERGNFDDESLRVLAQMEALNNTDLDAMEALLPEGWQDAVHSWMAALAVCNVMVSMMAQVMGVETGDVITHLRASIIEKSAGEA